MTHATKKGKENNTIEVGQGQLEKGQGIFSTQFMCSSVLTILIEADSKVLRT